MPWGEPHSAGAGNTKQIEDAHAAFDQAGIAAGPLALRALAAAGAIDRMHSAIQDVVTDYGDRCCDQLASCACSMARSARMVGTRTRPPEQL